ncbi:MAG: hypothetical protein AB7T37_13780 [Dehalococcoidia bacterium]
MAEANEMSGVKEVERDIQRYNAAFIEVNRTGDATLMRPWMRLPVMVFGNGSVRALTTHEELDAHYGRMAEALNGTGYEKSILDDFAITLPNSTTALVNCHARRLKTDGTVLQEFDATHIMARDEDHWRVACLLSRR